MSRVRCCRPTSTGGPCRCWSDCVPWNGTRRAPAFAFESRPTWGPHTSAWVSIRRRASGTCRLSLLTQPAQSARQLHSGSSPSAGGTRHRCKRKRLCQILSARGSFGANARCELFSRSCGRCQRAAGRSARSDFTYKAGWVSRAVRERHTSSASRDSSQSRTQVRGCNRSCAAGLADS